MDLELTNRKILCLAESHFNSIATLENFFKLLDESATLFLLPYNELFFQIMLTLSEMYDIDLIIKHPNYEDIDEFSKLCDALVVFSNSEDAESNDIIYNIVNSKNNHYEQVIVCSDEGVEVHENNSYG
jgi:hypothetical protein